VRKKASAENFSQAIDSHDTGKINAANSALKQANETQLAIRRKAVHLIKKNDSKADAANDTNYVFLNFVTHFLPTGLIGLLIAIVFLASMGSTASALNSLASTSVIDIYKRTINPNASDHQYLTASRLATVFWGLVCIAMALFAGKMGNLLEAVNKLGSYIYGSILGVFVVAFYLKRIRGTAVFIAAITTEITVIVIGQFNIVAYLWLNAIGCVLLIIIAWVLSFFIKNHKSYEVSETS
jgi:Na+/proline symporter